MITPLGSPTHDGSPIQSLSLCCVVKIMFFLLGLRNISFDIINPDPDIVVNFIFAHLWVTTIVLYINKLKVRLLIKKPEKVYVLLIIITRLLKAQLA